MNQPKYYRGLSEPAKHFLDQVDEDGQSRFIIQLESGQVIRMKLSDDEDSIFGEFFVKVADAVRSLPQKVMNRFPLVVDEIRPLLVEKFRIDPKPFGFTKWLLNNRSPFTMDFHPPKRPIHKWTVTVTLHDDVLNDLLNPPVLVSEIGKYCRWRQDQALAELGLNNDKKLSDGIEKNGKPKKNNTTSTRLPHKDPKNNDFNFKYYLKMEHQDQLIPFLVQKYRDAKPRKIAYMLIALEQLTILVKGSLTHNQTELHEALTATFGNVGTRQSLSENIGKLHNASELEEASIRIHVDKIKAFLFPKSE